MAIWRSRPAIQSAFWDHWETAVLGQILAGSRLEPDFGNASSNPYHGTIMKDPHKPFCVLAAFRGLESLSRDNYEGSTQGFCVLAAFRGPKSLSRDNYEGSTQAFRILAALGGLKSLSRDNYEGSTQAFLRLGCI